MSIPIAFGEMEILEATADPTAGLAAGIGSVASWNDGGVGKVYWKHGVADAAWSLIGAGGGGETNTASNVGAGADIFKQKLLLDLEFRGINAASGKVTAVVNGDNIDIDLGAVALADLTDGATAVTAAAVLADNALVVGAGGARGVDGAGWTYTAATGDLAVGARGDKLDLSGDLGEYITSSADNKMEIWFGGVERIAMDATAGIVLKHHTRVNDGLELRIGSAANDAKFAWSTGGVDHLALGVGSPLDNMLVMSETPDIYTNWGHAAQPNPTLYVQSADATTIAQFISFAHNQTNGVIDVGTASALSITVTQAEALRVEDEATLGAAETSLWLYDDDNGQMEQVTVGAADSGGANFKVLRIPN